MNSFFRVRNRSVDLIEARLPREAGKCFLHMCRSGRAPTVSSLRTDVLHEFVELNTTSLPEAHRQGENQTTPVTPGKSDTRILQPFRWCV
jgi:hypothetical protein